MLSREQNSRYACRTSGGGTAQEAQEPRNFTMTTSFTREQVPSRSACTVLEIEADEQLTAWLLKD